MARIDRLLQAAAQAGSECLVLQAGERVFLLIGDGKRAVTPQPVTGRQIQELLAEIVPPEMAGTVEDDGDHEFTCRSPSGAVVVHLSRSGGSLTLSARFGLVKRGLVEPGEACASAIHKAEFKSLLERNNIRLTA